jgi:hypothetical protein
VQIIFLTFVSAIGRSQYIVKNIKNPQQRMGGFEYYLWNAVTINLPETAQVVTIPPSPAFSTLPWPVRVTRTDGVAGRIPIAECMHCSEDNSLRAMVFTRKPRTTHEVRIFPNTRCFVSLAFTQTTDVRVAFVAPREFSSFVDSDLEVDMMMMFLRKPEYSFGEDVDPSSLGPTGMLCPDKVELKVAMKGNMFALVHTVDGGEPVPLTVAQQSGGLELDFFIAAAGTRDIYMFYILHHRARNGAFTHNRLVEYTDTMERYCEMLREARCFHDLSQAYSYTGEAYEALASKKGHEMRYMARAVGAYYAAVQVCIEHPHDVAREQIAGMYGYLGLALKRYGAFDAADAAYRWSLICPEKEKLNTQSNLAHLLAARAHPERNKESLKTQKNYLKESMSSLTCDSCYAFISKKLLCSRCMSAVYCSR